MKLIIVLCALVACAAAIVPQERGIIEDKVRSIVDDAINKAQSDIATVKADIQSLTSSVKDKMSSILTSAQNQISGLMSSAQTTIAGVIAKGGAVATCAQSALSQLNAATFARNAENCAVTTAEFEANVLAVFTELTSSIAELTEIVEECTVDIWDAVVCAVTKVRTVDDLIGQIVDSVEDAIDIARGKSTVTLSDVTTCTQQVVSEATAGINKIVNIAQTCA